MCDIAGVDTRGKGVASARCAENVAGDVASCFTLAVLNGSLINSKNRIGKTL